MDKLWERRSNSSRLSLSTSHSNAGKDGGRTDSTRTFSATKRFGAETPSHSKSNPFNAITSPGAAGLTSPTTGASSAFGLGSGAFASFGPSNKVSKTPNATETVQQLRDRQEKDVVKPEENIKSKASLSSLNRKPSPAASEHPIKSTWVVWYRPPTSKYSDYEKSTIALASFATVEAFWTVYVHLKRPSALPAISDYHIFKKGIRPVWEDDENKRGGKWIVRLRKGVADRYWEDLLFAIVGDQFAEAGEEVCGAVLSVRREEDVLSVWTRIDGGRNIKIRETIKRLLAFPPDTNIVWKSHDDSIAQRSAIDQARQDKTPAPPHPSKRRETVTDDSLERARVLL